MHCRGKTSSTSGLDGWRGLSSRFTKREILREKAEKIKQETREREREREYKKRRNESQENEKGGRKDWLKDGTIVDDERGWLRNAVSRERNEFAKGKADETDVSMQVDATMRKYNRKRTLVRTRSERW